MKRVRLRSPPLYHSRDQCPVELQPANLYDPVDTRILVASNYTGMEWVSLNDLPHIDYKSGPECRGQTLSIPYV